MSPEDSDARESGVVSTSRARKRREATVVEGLIQFCRLCETENALGYVWESRPPFPDESESLTLCSICWDLGLSTFVEFPTMYPMATRKVVVAQSLALRRTLARLDAGDVGRLRGMIQYALDGPDDPAAIKKILRDALAGVNGADGKG